MNGTPLMKCLFQSIEDEPGMRRPAHPPADDAAREYVDDEGHIDETLPGGDIGEIRNPEPVRRGSLELAVHPVERARSRLVRDRRSDRLAADDALKAHRPHEPGDGATGHVEALLLQLPPDLAHAVDAEVRLENAAYLDLQCNVAAGAD